MSSKRVCPNCGRKMKQQFIGLFHCKCGLSWKRDIGFFERTPNMVFALERIQAGKKAADNQQTHNQHILNDGSALKLQQTIGNKIFIIFLRVSASFMHCDTVNQYSV